MSWITLAEAKTRLGIDCADPSMDAKVQEAIDYAIAIVERYCQRKFEQASYTQEFFPVEYTVYLENWPVASVDEVWLDDEEDTDPEYTLDPIRGVVYFKQSLNNWSQKDLLRVVYTGGYSPIPPDLLNATLDVVKIRFETVDDDPSKGPVRAERIEGSVSVSYGPPTGNDPSLGVLSPYALVLNTYRSERTQGAW